MTVSGGNLNRQFALADFSDAASTSLAALSHPLSEAPLPASHKPCPQCEARKAEHEKALADASQMTEQSIQSLKSELKSQIDAMTAEVMESQAFILREILTSLMPDMAFASLRQTVQQEINSALTVRERPVLHCSHELAKLFEADASSLGVSITPDETFEGLTVELRRTSGRTTIDMDSVVKACLAPFSDTQRQKETSS